MKILILVFVSATALADCNTPDYATNCPCDQVWTGTKCAEFKSSRQKSKFDACIAKVEIPTDYEIAMASAKCWKISKTKE